MGFAGETSDPDVDGATAPARWLLAMGAQGVPLTQTHALARGVVREAAARWPDWWDAELFGPPHRETDLAVLHALHEGLRRLRLLRRRGRRLLVTARGRELAADAEVLLAALAADLGAGDPFTDEIAGAVLEELARHEQCDHDALDAAAFARIQRVPWRGPDGRPPSERDVGWVVGDVLRRGEAYGLIERQSDVDRPRLRSQIALTSAGRRITGRDQRRSRPMPVLIFDAKLMNARGVAARLAVSSDQQLTALHDAIQEAFGWYDDHLYAFWLDGSFWGDEDTEFTSPLVPDEGVRTADVPIDELDLAEGATLAYVFDFGDDWRVRLTLRGTEPSDGGRYPRVLERRGQAPSQYPGIDETD